MKPEDKLHELLQSLPLLNRDNEMAFTQQVIPQFVSILGYEEHETFYELSGCPLTPSSAAILERSGKIVRQQRLAIHIPTHDTTTIIS